jgi:DNA-directed RNA polymerase subunit beta'
VVRRRASRRRRSASPRSTASVGLERVTTVDTPNEDRIVTSREGQILLKTPEGAVRSRLAVPYGATLAVEEGQTIESGDLLFSWDPYSEPIVADAGG